MLRPRIVPCLLMSKNGLVKTVKFEKPKYVGDPINAVKIFNEKKVDELVILDIEATSKNREPNFKLLEKIANVSRMPLAYGGGVSSIEHFQKIISLGIENVILSIAFIYSENFIKDCSNQFGSQSVVICLDFKRKRFSKNRIEVYTNNGKTYVDKDLI